MKTKIKILTALATSILLGCTTTGSSTIERKAAENNNAENLLIISSMDLAKYFIENWERHKGHSEPYMGR